jgi:hypothetical protein
MYKVQNFDQYYIFSPTLTFLWNWLKLSPFFIFSSFFFNKQNFQIKFFRLQNDFILYWWYKNNLRTFDTIGDKVCQRLTSGWWFSPGTPVPFTNKTDSHNITEILLKVELNTITPPSSHYVLPGTIISSFKFIYIKMFTFVYKMFTWGDLKTKYPSMQILHLHLLQVILLHRYHGNPKIKVRCKTMGIR